MQTVTSKEIVLTLKSIVANAGSIPKTFHTDFDHQLIGGHALHWIQANKSHIIATNASCQLSHSLVECNGQSIVCMAHDYITKKQGGREFWFYAIQHLTRMVNQILGCLGHKLPSPVELVHSTKPDATTWFELSQCCNFSR
jgi:hypothetical protein